MFFFLLSVFSISRRLLQILASTNKVQLTVPSPCDIDDDDDDAVAGSQASGSAHRDGA